LLEIDDKGDQGLIGRYTALLQFAKQMFSTPKSKESCLAEVYRIRYVAKDDRAVEAICTYSDALKKKKHTPAQLKELADSCHGIMRDSCDYFLLINGFDHEVCVRKPI